MRLHNKPLVDEEINTENIAPEIMAIVQRGKRALKDRQSLSALMQAFQSHAKIAKILVLIDHRSIADAKNLILNKSEGRRAHESRRIYQARSVFLDYLQVERNVSHHTLRAYHTDLIDFAQCWHDTVEQAVKDIPLQNMIERYLVNLSNENFPSRQ